MPQGIDFNTIMELRQGSSGQKRTITKKKKSSSTSNDTLARRYSKLGGKSKTSSRAPERRTISKTSSSRTITKRPSSTRFTISKGPMIPQDASGTPVQAPKPQPQPGGVMPGGPGGSPAMFIRKLPPQIAQLAAKYGRL